MSTQALSQAQLLTCGDADFDNNIKNMAVKELMGLISSLQKEMAKEQENFNGLSSALQGLKDRNSRQYKTISRDMVASQGRLTTLMNRSMKCFSQLKDQDFLPAKQTLEPKGQGGDGQLQRRNSSKAVGSTSPNSSPVKSATSVQRSRSMYAVNQPNDSSSSSDNKQQTPNTTNTATTTAASTLTSQASSSKPVVPRGGGGGGVVTRAVSDRGQARRPASVAVVGGSVNGGVAASNDSSKGSRLSSATAAGRVSVGVASSASLSSLNVQPQPHHQPVVMGSSGSSSSGGGGLSSGLVGSYTGGGPQERVRSRSQILITPSVPASSSTPLAKAFANVRKQQQSPRSNSNNNASSSSTPFASLLTHASSQPSLASSTSSTSSPSPTPPSQGPGASSPSPSSSAQDAEKGYNGLPSVRQLARTFGAAGSPASSSNSSGGQTNKNNDNNPATTKTNYRPVIRAQSVASADASSRRPNLTSSASPNKVNGVPASSLAGARVPASSSAAGQSSKRVPAPKTPAGGGTTAAANGQSEFEKIHSKLRATRELNLAALPDKPPSVTSQSSSAAHGNSSTREVSYFTTNLDRQKSSSSIALGQKSNFDNSNGTSSSAAPAGSSSGASSQGGGMRRAQSREELYAIESKARGQKDALMKQIGAAAAGRKGSTDDESYDSMPISGQWGLKGNSLLAQRLQQGRSGQ